MTGWTYTGLMSLQSRLMDLIVHDTLVKITCDYFESSEIEDSKRILYQCDAVTSLVLHPIRRRNGPTEDQNNIADVLYVLHKCPAGLPVFAVSDPCRHWMSTMLTLPTYWEK